MACPSVLGAVTDSFEEDAVFCTKSVMTIDGLLLTASLAAVSSSDGTLVSLGEAASDSAGLDLLASSNCDAGNVSTEVVLEVSTTLASD